jgi:hypothetical protein
MTAPDGIVLLPATEPTGGLIRLFFTGVTS